MNLAVPLLALALSRDLPPPTIVVPLTASPWTGTYTYSLWRAGEPLGGVRITPHVNSWPPERVGVEGSDVELLCPFSGRSLECLVVKERPEEIGGRRLVEIARKLRASRTEREERQHRPSPM